MALLLSPAAQLEGRTLENGWKVIRKVNRPLNATGGFFSYGYIAESVDGRQGFLKALDYSKALADPDPARVLQWITEAFNFERRLCEQCREKRLDRVVKAITDGKTMLDPADPSSVVQYLIFELAEGDVRNHLDLADAFDVAWAFRALHNVANGLRQLHGIGIAHQDLKPSNVLVFPKENYSKIGDLGRAVTKVAPAPHDGSPIAGDRSYAPPEHLYGYVDPDWGRRRLGCDAYLLGSMVVFFFGRVNMTSLIAEEIYPSYHWKTWKGSFEEAIPFIRDAFGRAVITFSEDVPDVYREEVVEVVRQLCDPDPA